MSSTPPPELGALLAHAIEVAEAGGRETLRWFQADFAVERKGDGTPVTIADRTAEATMRARIAQIYPDHAIQGEEAGHSGDSDARVRWIVDPIDGTKSFVAGVPLYGTLVGIELDGEPVVGVIHHPALGDTVAAARGEGCTWNGRPCRVAADTALDEALLVVTDHLESEDRGRGFGDLARQVRLVRTWADCYGYALVATGRAHIAIDPEMDVWDCAALLPIIEEAGGRFTTWDGERTIRGADAVATNGSLHPSVIEHLSRATR